MRFRTLTPELMDDPALDPGAHRRALRGLSRLNRFGAASVVYDAIVDLTSATSTLRVLDIATGGGDIPIGVLDRAERDGVQVECAACDISGTAIEHARRIARRRGVSIELFTLDALRDPLPEGFDVLTCSLFTHHLTDEQTVHLLRRMARAAQRRIVVNDLVRSRFNAAIVTAGAYALSRSPVVHTDARRSVAAAYTVAEAEALAIQAGLSDARVRPRFPARFVLTWDKR